MSTTRCSPKAGTLESYHLVRFAGHLDISRYPEFREAFEGVPAGVPVLVDLTEIEGVDSTFLSELLLLKRRHAAPVATLIAPATNVARLFDIAKLDTKMSVYTDLSAAVAALGFRAAKEGAGEEVGAE